MRTLHETYKDRAFTVLAFPCNQFGAQEPGSNEEIHAFATSKYDVTFPMFAKIEVNGDGACALYRMLKTAQPAEDGNPDIPWNFTKFLVSGDGEVVARFGPQVAPEDLTDNIEEVLAG